MKNKWIKMTAAAAAIVGFSANVQATLISPSSSIIPTPAAPVSPTTDGSSTLIASMSGVISSATLQGTLSSYVYTDTANSLGGYVFVYVVSNSTGPDGVTALGIDGWQTILTDVGQYGSGVASSSVQRSLTGNTITFNWQSPATVNPGGTSDYLVIDTAFRSYQTVSAGLADGSGTTTTALGINLPDGGVTVMLLGAALSAMGLLRRKLIA
jgi:hypothetical protein